jgi:hypothetical protein
MMSRGGDEKSMRISRNPNVRGDVSFKKRFSEASDFSLLTATKNCWVVFIKTASIPKSNSQTTRKSTPKLGRWSQLRINISAFARLYRSRIRGALVRVC